MKKMLLPVQTALVMSLFGILIWKSAQAARAVQEALRLCGTTVIPSLFPFFVLSGYWVTAPIGQQSAMLLGKPMERLFSVSRNGAPALLFGLLGGYPLGASTIADLYRQNDISRTDACRLLRFCCNTGPGFFLGAVGMALFQDAAVGVLLYLIHVLSAVTVGLLFYRGKTVVCRSFPQQKSTAANALANAVPHACKSILIVCAYVAFFSAVTAVSSTIWQKLGIAGNIGKGLLEMTSGVLELPIQLPKFSFCLAEILVTFGGFCVMAQTYGILSAVGLPLSEYLLGKIMQTAIAGIMAVPVAEFYFGRNTPILLGAGLIYIVLLSVHFFCRKKARKSSSILHYSSI